MTIAERKAREPLSGSFLACERTITDDVIGMICELRISYHGAAMYMGHRRFWTFRSNRPRSFRRGRLSSNGGLPGSALPSIASDR
jgi:hypothetical protein